MPIMLYVAYWGVLLAFGDAMAGVDDYAAWTGWRPSVVQS